MLVVRFACLVIGVEVCDGLEYAVASHAGGADAAEHF
jgi:hypothetical protein